MENYEEKDIDKLLGKKKKSTPFFDGFGILEWILFIIFVIVVVFLIYMGLGYLLMITWNGVIPAVFGLVKLTFWQAVNLLILLTIFSLTFKK